MKQEEYTKIKPCWEILKDPLEPFLSFYLTRDFSQIEKGKFESVKELLNEYEINDERKIFTFCTFVLYLEARLQQIRFNEGKGHILEILDKFKSFLENNSIKELNFKSEDRNTGFATSFKIDNKALIELLINSVQKEFDRHEIQSSPATESPEEHIKTMGKHIFTLKGKYVIKGNEKRKKGRISLPIVKLQREQKTTLEVYLLSFNNPAFLVPGNISYFIGKILSIAGLIESESDYESRPRKGKESYSSYRDFLRRRIESL